MRLVSAAVLLAALVPLQPLAAQGADDREQVRAAVLDYVEGFYLGDTTRFLRSIRPEVYKYGFARARDGSGWTGNQMPFGGFMQFANGVKAGRITTPPNAPKEIVLLDVQDRTAAAKLTAWWGTDYLLLGRFGDRWMITHVLWQSPPAK